MLYKGKSITEIEEYYGMNDERNTYGVEKSHLKDCEKIQQAFIEHAIILNVKECEELYLTFSDEAYCSGWANGIDTMELESIFKLLLPWLKRIILDRESRIEEIKKQIGQY